LDRDGFAQDQPITFDDSLRRIALVVENRSHDSHQTVLHLQGLPAGGYEVSVDRHPVSEFVIQDNASKEVAFSLNTRDSVRLAISRH
jgi:hypothetical protein